MSEDLIPGTVVPDHAIHRASIWLERLKFAERAGETNTPEGMDDFTLRAFVEETGIDVTLEQLSEAATYYGTNFDYMVTRGRLEVQIPSPTGQGTMNLRSILISVWLDGFMHGAAAATGKTERTPAEEDE